MIRLEGPRLEAFKCVVRTVMHWYGDELLKGVDDDLLAQRLETAIGWCGGCGPDIPSYDGRGNGLRVWISPDQPPGKPTIKGRDTLALVREIYRIPYPDQFAFDLFSQPEEATS